MARYDLYLFLHVVGAIVWLGSGLFLSILAYRASRAGDKRVLHHLIGEASALSDKVFIPASLTVLVFGLLMVFDGPWGFDQLWIVLGLGGFAATLATGVLFVKPTTERIDAMVARDGGVSDAAVHEIQRLLIIGRADVVVLYLIVMDMVLKPTGDQIGVLAVMAAVLLAALIYAVRGVRALAKPTGFTPATGAPAGA